MAETDPIRIVILDSRPLFREGLRKLLEGEPDLQVAAATPEGDSICEALESSQADVLLLGSETPEVNAYDVLRQLRDSGLRADAILLTANQGDLDFGAVVSLGARGVVSEKALTQDLFQAIRQVHQGFTWLDPNLCDLGSDTWSRLDPLLKERRSQQRGHRRSRRPEQLTPRESEVASLVAGGLRYKEIAGRLRMSPSTLNRHLRSLFGKLRGRDRAEPALCSPRKKV